MAGEIRRIHLDLAGDVGFRDLEPGDLIMAKQVTAGGTFTAEARVFAVGEDWVQIQCHNDFPATDRLDWVRVGNDTDFSRQAFIRLSGSGDGSPRQEFRARVASFEDLKNIDTLVMLEGNLDGVQHPVMGKLEKDGVLCTNLYAIGQMWVKIGDELKEAGAEFKVQADLIESKVARKEFDTLSGTVAAHGTAITQTAEAIALKAESSTVDALGNRVSAAESSITQQAELIETKVSQSTFDEMGNRVATAESKITQLSDKIELQVTTAELETVGIKIEGADKGVHVRANEFDVSATSGAKLLEASADGNRVTMRNVDIGGSATIANGATIGDVVVQGGALYWSKNGYTASVGSPVLESGDTVVGQFIAPDDFITGNPVVAVMVQGDILFNRGGIRNFSLYMEVIDRSKVAEGSECVCINSAGISVQLPDLGTHANGRVIYIHRRGYGEVVIRPRQESTSIAAGEKIMWGENNSTSDYAIPKRGYVVRAVRYDRTWYLNLMGW